MFRFLDVVPAMTGFDSGLVLAVDGRVGITRWVSGESKVALRETGPVELELQSDF